MFNGIRTAVRRRLLQIRDDICIIQEAADYGLEKDELNEAAWRISGVIDAIDEQIGREDAEKKDEP